MKRTIVVILIIGAIAIGAALYLRTLPQFSGQENKTPVAQKESKNNSKSTSNTLKILLATKTPQKCTYSVESAATSGTVYVSNGKVRGDYATTVEGKPMSGHVIVSGGYSYVWSDGNTQGFKMAMNLNEVASISGDIENRASSQMPDLNQKVDYNCSAWAADEKLFAPPSDVTFSSFAAPSLPTANTPSSSNNESACAVCDNIPDAQAKEACKTQLKCD
jgi:hypothetical protein